MNADQNDRNIITKWPLIAMAAAFLMLVCAVWWASSASVPAKSKVDIANGYGNYSNQAKREIPQGSERGNNGLKVATITAKPVAPEEKKVEKKESPPPRCSKPKYKNSVHDMFPMGNVINSLPNVKHIYRVPAESFPSFYYADKMWSFKGTFVYSSEIDLTSIGFNVGDKKIFALADTKGPGRALFVQSERNPEKFAIYR